MATDSTATSIAGCSWGCGWGAVPSVGCRWWWLVMVVMGTVMIVDCLMMVLLSGRLERRLWRTLDQLRGSARVRHGRHRLAPHNLWNA